MPNFLNICSESSLLIREGFCAEAKLNLKAYSNWSGLPLSLLFTEGVIQFSARFMGRIQRVENAISILPVQLSSVVFYKPIVFDNYYVSGRLETGKEGSVLFEVFSYEASSKLSHKVASGNVWVKLIREKG